MIRANELPFDDVTNIICAHADHAPAVFARTSNRRDGSVFEKSPPPFKRSWIRSRVSDLLSMVA